MSDIGKFIIQWMKQYPEENFWISDSNRLCCSNGKSIELPLYAVKIMAEHGIKPKLNESGNAATPS